MAKMKIKIDPALLIYMQHITIILMDDIDMILLETTMPGTIPGNEYLVISFDATKGTGKEYCKKHFPGIEIKEKYE